MTAEFGTDTDCDGQAGRAPEIAPIVFRSPAELPIRASLPVQLPMQNGAHSTDPVTFTYLERESPGYGYAKERLFCRRGTSPTWPTIAANLLCSILKALQIALATSGSKLASW